MGKAMLIMLDEQKGHGDYFNLRALSVRIV